MTNMTRSHRYNQVKSNKPLLFVVPLLPVPPPRLLLCPLAVFLFLILLFLRMFRHVNLIHLVLIMLVFLLFMIIFVFKPHAGFTFVWIFTKDSNHSSR